jgi:hypothetical protein
MGECSDSSVADRTSVAEMTFLPFSSVNGTTMKIVEPTAHSPTGAGSRPSRVR